MSRKIINIFKDYEFLLKEADILFARVRDAHPECVSCRPNCVDCCYAVFELFQIEAAYLNYHFKESFKRKERRDVLRRAEKALSDMTKLKLDARQQGNLLSGFAEGRIRCPLLSDEGKCILYEFRPITCRLYGIPTAISGAAHTCGRSNFEKGKSYPTVNWDPIHERVFALSGELMFIMKGRTDWEEARQLLPVALALKSDYLI